MDELIESITKALTEKFGKNPSAPSLLMSYIGDGKYYVSILEYKSTYGRDKHVLFSAEGNNLYVLLEKISKEMIDAWLPKQDELTKLKKLIN